jgi:hypothetical protein
LAQSADVIRVDGARYLHWLRRCSVADLVRLAVGCGCVSVAAVLLIVHTPRVIRSANGTVRSDAYIVDSTDRTLTSGDMLGVSRTLQVEALAVIPRGAAYVLALPATVAKGARYGIAPVTYDVTFAWLRYLLLPDRPVEPSEARYVICWGCDRTQWNGHTRWLWRNDQGQAIGRVRV